MKKIVAVIIFFLVLPLYAQERNDSVIRLNLSERYGTKPQAPSPALVYPVDAEVDVGDKLFLEFRWEPQDPYHVWYYMFRVYRGYEMAPSKEIFVKRVSGVYTAVAVRTDIFRNGEGYTWSVVQVNAGPRFSEPVFHSFRFRKDQN